MTFLRQIHFDYAIVILSKALKHNKKTKKEDIILQMKRQQKYVLTIDTYTVDIYEYAIYRHKWYECVCVTMGRIYFLYGKYD